MHAVGRRAEDHLQRYAERDRSGHFDQRSNGIGVDNDHDNHQCGERLRDDRDQRWTNAEVAGQYIPDVTDGTVTTGAGEYGIGLMGAERLLAMTNQ